MAVDPPRQGVGLTYLRARLAQAPVPGTLELVENDARVLARLELPQ